MKIPILDNYLRHRQEVIEIRTNAWNAARRMLGHYDAAGRGRLEDDWTTITDTTSQNFKTSWRILIARAISSADNDPHTQAIIGTLLSNVIGSGLRPMARVKDEQGNLVEDINKILNEGWKRYNDEWDAMGRCTHLELQRTRFNEVIRTGSTLTNLRPSEKGSFLSVSNQVVNVLRLDDSRDLLSTSFDNPAVKNTLFGINVNDNGKAVGFNIRGIDKSVSADVMRLSFRTVLAEQYIGMPWLLAALKYLFANERLIKDKMVASRIQAMISLYVPDNLMNKLIKGQKNVDNQLKWQPGKVFFGEKGGEPKIIQADDSIKDVLEPLQRLLLHAISMTQGLSYQTVTRDLVRTNMASARINVNEDRKVYRTLQKWCSKDICQPDWDIFVRFMFLEGKIPGKSIIDYNKSRWRYNQAQWIPSGFDFIDPSKEATAAIELINNNQMTYEQWYGERGMDYRDAFQQISDEKKLMKKLDIEKEVQEPQNSKDVVVGEISEEEKDDL